MKPFSLVARKFEQKRWKPSSLVITIDAASTVASLVSMIRRLSCALSKSFCELPVVGVVGGVAAGSFEYGNGTVDVSWLTNTSTLCLPALRSEMPSGIASNRYPPIISDDKTLTVMIGSTQARGATGISIEGCFVSNPWAPVAPAGPAMPATTATRAKVTNKRERANGRRRLAMGHILRVAGVRSGGVRWGP